MTDLPILRGFGDSVVSCLGKCDIDIEVDSAKATVEALVVPDHLLRVPLLLGQTFTEQDHIIVYKTKDQLNITDDSTKNIQLYTNSTSNIKGYTEIDVYSKPEYTGNLFIKHSLCQNPDKQYEVVQSVVRLTKGQGKIVLRGLLATGFDLTENLLILRALPLNEILVPTSEVNRVEHCPSNEDINQIEPAMLQVDNIESHYIEKLNSLTKRL